MSKIRVKIVITLDVNVEDWATEFGTDATRTAVRDDVKAYFAASKFVPDHLQEIVSAA